MPSELGIEDMVSRQDDESVEEEEESCHAESEVTSLDNTSRPEESENETTIRTDDNHRNDNYAYSNNVDEAARNLDNTLQSLNSEIAIENATDIPRIMENDLENNVTDVLNQEDVSSSDEGASAETPMVSSIDNTTQTTSQDVQTQPSSKKNFSRCIEGNSNNASVSLYDTDRSNDERMDDGAASSSLSAAAASLSPIAVDSSSSGGESSSTCDNDIVFLANNKPFKLPSLVNLYEAAEAQRAEFEDRDDTSSVTDIEPGLLFDTAEANGCDREQQSSEARRNRKVSAFFFLYR